MSPRTSPPHGTTARYNRGCHATSPCPARPTCADAWAHRANTRKLRKLRGEPGPLDLVPAGPAVRHVRHLLDVVPGSSARAVGRAAGVASRAVNSLLTEGETRRIRYSTEQQLLAVTATQVTAVAHQEPAAETIRLVRAIQAQGFPLSWVAARLGQAASARTLPFLYGPEWVTAATAAKVRRLARAVEGKQGADFVPELTARRSAVSARRAGGYPLAAYDDNGVLIPSAVRHEPAEARKQRRDDKARTRLTALQLTLAGAGSSLIAEQLGCKKRTVDRWRSEAGLTTRGDVMSAARREMITEFVARYFAEPDLDAYETCLSLGMMKDPQWLIAAPPQLRAA